MYYDGPSFNHRRKQVDFNPFDKELPSKSKRPEKKSLDFSTNHYEELPDRVKTRQDYRNEAEKILTTPQPKRQQLFETRRRQKYRPRFRVTEVPSPMFGYTEEQRERMGLGPSDSEEEIEWNYKALKDLMLQKHYDFILTEECVNTSILKSWQTEAENVSDY